MKTIRRPPRPAKYPPIVFGKRSADRFQRQLLVFRVIALIQRGERPAVRVKVLGSDLVVDDPALLTVLLGLATGA